MSRDTVPGDPVWLASDDIVVGVATTFGPRIVWCGRPGEPNLFADLGDLALDVGDGRRYTLRGGHRVWVGPELPELTYQPDDGRVTAVLTEHTVTVTSHADDFGLVKSIEVALVPGESAAVIDHAIKATASATLDIAPWAITQLRAGGTGVLPLGLPGGPLSDFQAAHEIMMWPYTDPNEPMLDIGQTEITVGTALERSTKIGTPLLRGWLAYLLDDIVFVKQATVDGDRFVDLGATGQIYASADFIELETLGPIAPISNNATIHHRETWKIHDRPAGAAADIGRLLELDGANG